MSLNSNYSKVHVIRKNGVPTEQVCVTCHGSGEDRKITGADCTTCWGEGTLPLHSAGYTSRRMVE